MRRRGEEKKVNMKDKREKEELDEVESIRAELSAFLWLRHLLAFALFINNDFKKIHSTCFNI